MMPSLKWRIALGLVLVFLAGAATGLFAGAWHFHHAFSDRHGGMMGDRIREHLKRELNLTPEQLQQVDPILQQTTQRLEDIRTETGERVFQTMEDAHRELAKHLTPEQVAKMEEMKKHHLKIIHRRGKHHWRHEAPPPSAP
jgi:Spy/CpxP family protein refolding chaperone